MPLNLAIRMPYYQACLEIVKQSVSVKKVVVILTTVYCVCRVVHVCVLLCHVIDMKAHLCVVRDQ